MSFNGNGVFLINTAGQPVVSGTTISSSVFNALTADLAAGLSNCMTKDGQQTITANIPMGGFKFTGLASGAAATDSARVDNCNSLNLCEFRLSGTAGSPVTTSDVTAIETLYFEPYCGNRIALYDGTRWVMRAPLLSLSIDVPDATGMYDVFIYDSALTPVMELVAWTNDTTRATLLTRLDGVLVKSGDPTRRYVGSFYCTTAGNGQTEDSAANRYIWNYYNRLPRIMRVLEGTNSWTYSTATIRQANGATTNQLNFCVGVSEDPVSATVSALSTSTLADTPNVWAGIGLDSTTAAASGTLKRGAAISTLGGTGNRNHDAEYAGFPGVGKHYLSWLEQGSGAVSTDTWYGDNGGTLIQTGIYGVILG